MPRRRPASRSNPAVSGLARAREIPDLLRWLPKHRRQVASLAVDIVAHDPPAPGRNYEPPLGAIRAELANGGVVEQRENSAGNPYPFVNLLRWLLDHARPLKGLPVAISGATATVSDEAFLAIVTRSIAHEIRATFVAEGAAPPPERLLRAAAKARMLDFRLRQGNDPRVVPSGRFALLAKPPEQIALLEPSKRQLRAIRNAWFELQAAGMERVRLAGTDTSELIWSSPTAARANPAHRRANSTRITDMPPATDANAQTRVPPIVLRAIARWCGVSIAQAFDLAAGTKAGPRVMNQIASCAHRHTREGASEEEQQRIGMAYNAALDAHSAARMAIDMRAEIAAGDPNAKARYLGYIVNRTRVAEGAARYALAGVRTNPSRGRR